jgi:hypothetical protein
MSGKNPRLNPLTLQKKLLIAESELNRAQLVQDWRNMSDEVQAIKSRLTTISSVAATAVALFAIPAALGRNKSAPAASENKSRWRSTLKYAGLLFEFWQTLRPQIGKPK